MGHFTIFTTSIQLVQQAKAYEDDKDESVIMSRPIEITLYRSVTVAKIIAQTNF